MTRRINIDPNHLRELYDARISVLEMSKRFGVSRMTINKRLEELGLPIRSGSEAMYIRMANTTKEERLALTEKAHAAVRGVRQTTEQRMKFAATREARGEVVSAYERQMGAWLAEAGINFVPQKAVGIYNIDIAITESRIAVEIFGGNWHATGSHAAGYRKRIEYLMSQGWLPVIVWAVKVWKTIRFDKRSADYVIALHNVRRADKSMPTQEHVIRGDAKTTPFTTINPDNGALIMGFNTGNDTRDAYGRFA